MKDVFRVRKVLLLYTLLKTLLNILSLRLLDKNIFESNLSLKNYKIQKHHKIFFNSFKKTLYIMFKLSC
jgi:hypothetical protein